MKKNEKIDVKTRVHFFRQNMNRLLPNLISQFRRISLGHSLPSRSPWIPTLANVRPLTTVVTRTKVTSKRKYKKYKLKNNKAAVTR